jgi:hypothetical protein
MMQYDTKDKTKAKAKHKQNSNYGTRSTRLPTQKG